MEARHLFLSNQGSLSKSGVSLQRLEEAKQRGSEMSADVTDTILLLEERRNRFPRRYVKVEERGRFRWKPERRATGDLIIPAHHQAWGLNADGCIETEIRRCLDLDSWRAIEIVAELGFGGMGEVWQVRDRRSRAEGAMKVCHPSDERYNSALKRETRALSLMSTSSTVPTLLGFGIQADGRAFHITSLLQGESLDKHLRHRGPLPSWEVKYLGSQLCMILCEVRRAGLLTHGDIKPANLMLCWDGTLKVIDFGCSLFWRAEASLIRGNEEFSGAGSRSYAAPERITRDHIDHRSDIYSACVVLYEMLTGHRPFEGGDVPLRHLLEVPAAPSSFRPDLPAGFDEVVLRGLAKRPSDRYDDAQQLQLALEALPNC